MGDYKEIGAVGHFLSSILFILAIQSLSSSKTAKKGIYIGIFGMGLAIIMTLYKQERDHLMLNVLRFCLAFMAGGVIGYIIVQKIKMVKLPQNLAFLQTFVGFAIILVSFNTIVTFEKQGEKELNTIEIFIGMFLGAFKTSSSIIAYLKLEQKIDPKPIHWFDRQIQRNLFNISIILADIVLLFVFFFTQHISLIILLALFNLILGIHISISIKVQDIPILVAFLSGISGYATAASGFMIDNSMLIICGALIGSAGMMLSDLVSRCYNRNFWRVILSLPEKSHVPLPKTNSESNIENSENELQSEEVVQILLNSKQVIIVPGYNLAIQDSLSQIQQISSYLNKNSIPCKFCLHPMAGRIPGQMGVLLAEAGIPKNQIIDNSQFQSEFRRIDTVFVLEGAHLCNPNLVEEKKPVCKVWEAKKVIVLKRGRKSELENPLFSMPQVQFFFGGASERLQDILQGFKREDEIKLNYGDQSLESQHDITQYLSKATFKLGVVKENQKGEMRVAITPLTAKKLLKLGFLVQVEKGAGLNAGFEDEEYERNGARIVSSQECYSSSEIIMKIKPPSFHPGLKEQEFNLINRNKTTKIVISEVFGSGQEEFMKFLKKIQRRGTLENLPEIQEVQEMEAKQMAQKEVEEEKKKNSKSNSNNSEEEDEEEFQTIDDNTDTTKQRTNKTEQDEESIQKFEKINEDLTIFAIDLMQKSKRTQPFDIMKLMQQLIGQKSVFEVMNQVQQVGNLNVLIVGYSEKIVSVIQQLQKLHCTEEIRVILAGKGNNDQQLRKEFSNLNIHILEYTQNQDKGYVSNLIAKECQTADILFLDVNYNGKSSIIIHHQQISSMKRGSVIVDLSAEYGGNCECTQVNKIVEYSGVKIIGKTDYLSNIAQNSSSIYSECLFQFFAYILELNENPNNKAKNFHIDFEDEIIKQITLLKKGKVVKDLAYNSIQDFQIELDQSLCENIRCYDNDSSDKYRERQVELEIFQLKDVSENLSEGGVDEYLLMNFQFIDNLSQRFPILQRIRRKPGVMATILLILLLLMAFFIGSVEDAEFIEHLFVFLLSMFVGRTLVNKTDPILYTVLISAITALSGIIIVGSTTSEQEFFSFRSFQGFIGILFTSIDIFGGFIITYKILFLFQQ